jgi:ectoine hydroxylase-related dioxygenase (phytanoyl-CoA dioxygenase family)
VEGVLGGARLEKARKRLYGAAQEDLDTGRVQTFVLDYEEDSSNQRVWGLLNKGQIFVELAEDPAALDLLKHLLGWPFLLSNISANITGPGGGEMVLHADQLYVPEPWSGIHGANVLWMIDDFTNENGATRVVPDSHKWNRAPGPADHRVETVPLTGKAGTMVVMEGRVWHKTGNNRTPATRRAGIFAWYALPIYRAQENWFLSLNPQVRQGASETLLWLLGYKTQGLGLVNGAEPSPWP